MRSRACEPRIITEETIPETRDTTTLIFATTSQACMNRVVTSTEVAIAILFQKLADMLFMTILMLR
ncbi:hypothetical protein C0039_13200 [Pseudohalioglobus lutimaris]|uniref:Uncharacterized protein n=1 Tax=Pseudohalioglobus lutimaris TaxID=1737061 RepID=A0A2N5X0Z5_9GAMM|nr:hypothetical protein C0039_13200 [Pseudohalioglobus lutimaris]